MLKSYSCTTLAAMEAKEAQKDPQDVSIPAAGTMSRRHLGSCRQHDKANLYVLPFLSLSAIAGLLGFLPPYLVTNLFIAYIIVDLVWLCFDPLAVPSMQPVVVAHHIVTFLLLWFPYTHPTFAIFTCLDGLAEVNTIFVIARRYFSRNGHGGKIYNWCHWATFVPLRFMLYPVLVVVFWQALEGHPMWKKVWVCGAQVFLCVFNGLFLHTILTRHKFYESIRAVFSSPDLSSPSTDP